MSHCKFKGMNGRLFINWEKQAIVIPRKITSIVWVTCLCFGAFHFCICSIKSRLNVLCIILTYDCYRGLVPWLQCLYGALRYECCSDRHYLCRTASVGVVSCTVINTQRGTERTIRKP